MRFDARRSQARAFALTADHGALLIRGTWGGGGYGWEAAAIMVGAGLANAGRAAAKAVG